MTDLATIAHPPASRGVHRRLLHDNLPVIWRSSAKCFDTLPTEIIATIFHAGHSSSPQRQTEPFEVTIPFEITISHVSRLWREIATSTPSLWTTIIVDPPSNHQVAKMYLDRSSSCALDIYLRLCYQNYPYDALDALICHTSRWRRLFISNASLLGRERIQSLFQNISVPILDVLSISSGTWHSDHVGPIFTGGAPVLSFVRIPNLELHCPLSSVTTLHLDGVDTFTREEFGRLITAAPSLTHLSMYGYPLHGPSFGRIQLPNLRSLRLYSYADNMMENILLAISAPNLESMVLKRAVARSLASEHDPSLSDLGSFLQLRFLTLISDRAPDLSVVQQLSQVLPAVTHLTLLDHHGLYSLFQFLAPTNAGIIWPQLHTIQIEPSAPNLKRMDEYCGVLIGRGDINLKLWGRKEDTWPPGLGFVDEFDLFKLM